MMQATLRDKAENVIVELRDFMSIMIPATQLELRETTCVGDSVSSRVLGECCSTWEGGAPRGFSFFLRY